MVQFSVSISLYTVAEKKEQKVSKFLKRIFFYLLVYDEKFIINIFKLIYHWEKT